MVIFIEYTQFTNRKSVYLTNLLFYLRSRDTGGDFPYVSPRNYWLIITSA